MRKRYQVYLEEEPTEKVKDFLKHSLGLSFSNYLRMHLREFAQVLDESPASDKKPSEMTMSEFLETIQHWFKAADNV